MLNQDSIKALIRLIDDPDESVYSHVRDRLIECGPVAIPYLESSWEDENYGLAYHHRIENVIHEIHFRDIRQQLENWLHSDRDLLEGWIILTKFQYSGLDERTIREDLEHIQRDIWLEMNPRQTAYEKIRVFNKVFFGLHKFHGDTKHFHSPLNSYLNAVLESRKGNPLSLCMIYSIVAQRLKLPVYGVNLPNHFILAYMDESNTQQFLEEKNPYGVLFYINAFARGGLFDESEIDAFLMNHSIEKSRSFYEPCSNSTILRRMLTNLMASYEQMGNPQKVNELSELRDLLA